jgi:hypothetical protein
MNALQQLPLMLANIPSPKQPGGPWGNMTWDALQIAYKQVGHVHAQYEL